MDAIFFKKMSIKKLLMQSLRDMCWVHMISIFIIFWMGMMSATCPSIIFSLVAGLFAMIGENALVKKIKKRYNKAEASADIQGHGPIL